MSTEELFQRINTDPRYEPLLKPKDTDRTALLNERSKAFKAILADLERAGCAVDSLRALLNGGRANYVRALPVLIAWLFEPIDFQVKAGIVRVMSVAWARGVVEEPLMKLFYSLDDQAGTEHLRWAIGNAMESIASDTSLNAILDVALNTTYGKEREMFVLALGKISDGRAVSALMHLVNDPVVEGHAVQALGKLRAVEARPLIVPHLDHKKAWIRNAALHALSRIDKASVAASGKR